MRRIQEGIAFIQTNILYDMVGGKMCVAVSAFLYFSLGLRKKKKSACLGESAHWLCGSLWDGWKPRGHSLREPRAAQEGLFHFASPAGWNKKNCTGPSFYDPKQCGRVPVGPSSLQEKKKPNPILPIASCLRYSKKPRKTFEWLRRKKKMCELAGPPLKLTRNQHL